MNFETFKNFVVDNWQFIGVALVLVCNVILVLLKKKEKLTPFEAACEHVFSFIPYVISQAEVKFGSGHGEDKLNYVIDYCLSDIKDELCRDMTSGEKKYFIAQVKSNVDFYLSLPTKKGGFGRKYE